MAYSRWGGSNWYVFWHGSPATRMEDELLAIWHADEMAFDEVEPGRRAEFRWEELATFREDPRGLRLFLLEKKAVPFDESDPSFLEVSGYVDAWLEDVRKQYGRPGPFQDLSRHDRIEVDRGFLVATFELEDVRRLLIESLVRKGEMSLHATEIRFEARQDFGGTSAFAFVITWENGEEPHS